MWPRSNLHSRPEISRDPYDIAFALKFEKARNRTPDSRADFAAVQIQLADDRRETSGGSKPSTGRVELISAVLLGRSAITYETGLREPELAALLAEMMIRTRSHASGRLCTITIPRRLMQALRATGSEPQCKGGMALVCESPRRLRWSRFGSALLRLPSPL
jgi:hypothetical protein